MAVPDPCFLDSSGLVNMSCPPLHAKQIGTIPPVHPSEPAQLLNSGRGHAPTNAIGSELCMQLLVLPKEDPIMTSTHPAIF